VNLNDSSGHTSPIYTNSGQVPDPLKGDGALQSAFGTLAQAQSGTTGLTPQTIPTMKPNGTAPTLQPGVYNGGMQVQGTVTFGSGSPGTYVINGNLSFGAQANATLGPGLYIVNGNVDFGSNATVTGTGVTIVTAGAVTNNGGSTVNLSAPLSGATVGAPGVLFATKESGSDNKWNGGTSQTLAGGIYAPNSLIQINGNAGLPPNASGAGCLEVVASNIKITGSASLASNCSAFGSTLTFQSVPGVVALVQ
jgi:hypothetical protein